MDVQRSKFRIGLIQMACSRDPNENLAKAEWRIREAAGKGAQIICLQELFRSQYFCREELAELFDLAEPIPGPSTELLGAVAREEKVVVVGVTPNVVLATNTVWGGDPEVAAIASQVGAFGWSSSSLDSALLVTLPPGNYTAGVAGAGGDTGLSLVEVYEVP